MASQKMELAAAQAAQLEAKESQQRALKAAEERRESALFIEEMELRALQVRIRTIRAEFASEIAEIEEKWQADIDVLDDQIAQMEGLLDAHAICIAPIQDVPPEVLAQIFLYFVDAFEVTPWTVAKVSRLWYATATTTPELWRYISINPFRLTNTMPKAFRHVASLPDLKNALASSGDTKLHVALRFDEPFEEDEVVGPILDCLRDHLHRVEHLQLCDSMFCEVDTILFFAEPLSITAFASLHTLEIDGRWPSDTWLNTLSRPLRSLTVNSLAESPTCITSPWFIAVLPTLQTARLVISWAWNVVPNMKTTYLDLLDSAEELYLDEYRTHAEWLEFHGLAERTSNSQLDAIPPGDHSIGTILPSLLRLYWSGRSNLLSRINAAILHELHLEDTPRSRGIPLIFPCLSYISLKRRAIPCMADITASHLNTLEIHQQGLCVDTLTQDETRIILESIDSGNLSPSESFRLWEDRPSTQLVTLLPFLWTRTTNILYGSDSTAGAHLLLDEVASLLIGAQPTSQGGVGVKAMEFWYQKADYNGEISNNADSYLRRSFMKINQSLAMSSLLHFRVWIEELKEGGLLAGSSWKIPYAAGWPVNKASARWRACFCDKCTKGL